MCDNDEDAPPSLDTLPQQVTALRVKKPLERASCCVANDESHNPTTTADVAICQTKKKSHSQHAPFKTGFLLGGKTESRKKNGERRDGDGVPFLKGRSGMNSEAIGIPDMFKIPEAQEYQRYKQELTEKLKPNKETMKQVQGDPVLVDAFSDPEVMAAVGEVARNPKSFEKYKNDPKIVKFYEHFGKVMGKRLEAKEGN